MFGLHVGWCAMRSRVPTKMRVGEEMGKRVKPPWVQHDIKVQMS